MKLYSFLVAEQAHFFGAIQNAETIKKTWVKTWKARLQVGPWPCTTRCRWPCAPAPRAPSTPATSTSRGTTPSTSPSTPRTRVGVQLMDNDVGLIGKKETSFKAEFCNKPHSTLHWSYFKHFMPNISYSSCFYFGWNKNIRLRGNPVFFVQLNPRLSWSCYMLPIMSFCNSVGQSVIISW